MHTNRLDYYGAIWFWSCVLSFNYGVKVRVWVRTAVFATVVPTGAMGLGQIF